MPKVSIITPLYNGRNYIAKVIESITDQTYKDFEHIIIDDGSIDGSGDLIKEKFSGKIKYVYQENQGVAAANNNGLAIATGEYIAFCDQDDWWLPGKLEAQIGFFEKHPDIDLVYSDALMADAEGNILKETWMQSRKVSPCVGGYKECAVSLFSRNFICAPLVVMIRRSVVDKVGVPDRRAREAYDYDFWFRMLEAGYRFGYIDKPLAVWRTHAGQGSRKIRTMKHLQLMILLRFLRRRPSFFLAHPMLTVIKLMRTIAGFVVGNII